MNFEEAATLPCLATMHNAPCGVAGLQRPDVLIQGASSGAGLMAMQIAKFKGAKLASARPTDAMRRGAAAGVRRRSSIDVQQIAAGVDQVLKATGGERRPDRRPGFGEINWTGETISHRDEARCRS